MSWVVEKTRVITRGQLYEGTQAVKEWVPEPCFGEHPTRAAAVRHLVLTFIEPSVRADAPQEFFESHYQQWGRNVKSLRVRKA